MRMECVDSATGVFSTLAAQGADIVFACNRNTVISKTIFSPSSSCSHL